MTCLLTATLLALVPAPAAGAQELPSLVEEELGQVPEPEPEEPPRPLEGEGRTAGGDPTGEIDDTEEKGLGSFFQSSFALAGAYDRFSGSELVTLPDSSPPGRPDAPADLPAVVNQSYDVAETGWVLRPSLLFVHRPSARSSLVMAYEPELEQLDRGGQTDRISHSAGLVVDHSLSRRTDVTAGASYLDSVDPSRHLGGDSFILIPGRFEQQRIFGGISHRLRRATRLDLYAEYSSATNGLDTEDFPFDVADLSGTLALEQRVGRRSHVTLSYSYTDTEVEEIGADLPTAALLSGPVEAYRVGFGHRPGTRFSFHLGAGFMREEDPETGVRDNTWIGSAEVAREGRTVELRLRFDRSLFSFGTGDVAVPTGLDGPVLTGTVLRDTLADTVSFHVGVEPRGRLRWEQSIWLARRSLVEGDDVDSLVTATLLEVLLSGGNAARVGLFARFDYYDRADSDLFGDSLSRERFSLGLRVGLSGPQSKAAQRVVLDELRKVLPSGGRL